MFRKLSLALAVSAALSPVGVLALGLGDIVTRSALNENFKADIELVSVQPGEIDSIRAALASPGDFARAGIERPFLLSRLRFESIELADGRNVIRVTTRDPVREPFLDFLVEVNWPKGRLLREFTVLLDPPVTMDKAPAPIAAPLSAAAPVIQRQEPVFEPEPMFEPEPAPAPRIPPQALEPTVGEYGPVQPGSTLWSIANELVIPGSTTEQMAMALFRANPDAFAGNDINKLLVAAVLRVPERADILALTAGLARSEFRAAATGGPAPAEADRLVLATPKRTKEKTEPDAGSPTPGGEIERVKTDLMMVRETSESTRQETEHLRSRIRELEARLADIRQLLELKSDQLAQLQASRMDKAGAVEGMGQEAEIADAIMPETLPKDADAQLEPLPREEVVAEDQAQMPAEPEPAAPAEQPQVAEVQPPVTAQQPPVPDTKPAAPAPAPKPVEPQPAPEPAAAEAEGLQGLIDQAMSNPTYLAAGGGGAIVLLLLVWLLLRRRRQAEDEFNESVLFSSAEATTEEMGHPSTEREHVAAGESEEETSFISDFSPSDIDALQEETGEVDPAAEADVYIAYGRYQQAESLINQALEKSPDRLDLKAKLLEIHFTTRNIPAFTTLSRELYEAGVPESDPSTWERVASMGSELVPDHELFRGATPAEPLETRGSEMPDLEQDDLLSDSEALANLDLDLDTELSELPDEPMGGSSELLLPDDDSASVIEPPSKAVINADNEHIASPFGPDSGDADEMSEFSLDLDDLDSLEDVDFGDSAQGGEPGLGEPEGLSEIGLESLSTSFSESDSGRVEIEEDIPAISLDELDGALDQMPELDEGEPLSELLQEDDRNEEIETKLDLARAYIEMDDAEGASEILSEILEEGDATQKAAAQKVLDQIS